ncbi:hypothetical protein TCE0_039f13010 [Talaromyces pinophilus]|uniref:Uncharacterized protein n=1 Tax=Talaromyces pinophilus TaxID=128442 RepID=A0A6N4SLG6_TALPI|nr:hypothetical protein TCE0_039f13010 [Talaromyces pinophilus]
MHSVSQPTNQACANCARNDLECTFHDDALQEDIPRSYIQSLNKRIDHLTSQLALHETEIPTFESPFAASSTVGNLHILAPARPGSDLHLDRSATSRMTRFVFEALSSSQPPLEPERDLFEDGDSPKPSIHFVNKTQLVPSVVRFLLRRYERCIRARYDVPVPELVDNDGANFKKLSDLQQFKLLMACAIAAARESYRCPDWWPFAHICRNWANELVAPILCLGDADTFTAILLLLIYELADPRRGIMWELLDLAARTCLQLGWHQLPLSSVFHDMAINNSDAASQRGKIASSGVLGFAHIVSSLQTIFNRPNMLSNLKLPSQSGIEPLVELHVRIADQIYDTGRIYETQSCPCVGEAAILMGLLDSLDSTHPIVKETWLLYLPLCVKHKQCLYCFQEPDEPNAKGMTSLRENVLKAASGLIANVHQQCTSTDDFIPPVLASARAFLAGFSIATGICKRWIGRRDYVRDLINLANFGRLITKGIRPSALVEYLLMNSRGFGYGTFVTSLLSTPLGVTEKENICAAENRIRHFLLPQHTLSDAVGRLIAFYCTNFTNGSLLMMFGLTTATIAGHAKRATASAFFFVGYSTAFIFGPQFFFDREVPQYLTAFKAMNHPAQALRGDVTHEYVENEEILYLTDKQQPRFVDSA